MIRLLAARAPGLLKVLRESAQDDELLDGTLAECNRLADGRVDHSAKHRRHGVNVQLVTDPTGYVLWISPAPLGRTHELTAARTHRIIRICERQGVPVVADHAYQGAGPWVTTGLKRPPGGELSPPQHTGNRALAQARAHVERAMTGMTSIAAANLALERQR